MAKVKPKFPAYILPKPFTTVYVFLSDILSCQDTPLFFEALQKFGQTIGETQFIVEHIGALKVWRKPLNGGLAQQEINYPNLKKTIPTEIFADVLYNKLLQPECEEYYFTFAVEGAIYGNLSSWFIYHNTDYEVLIVGVDAEVEEAFKQCVLPIKQVHDFFYQDKVELEQHYAFRYEKHLLQFIQAYPMWSGLK